MPARRKQSLHFNLGNKNVMFHREHRSKRGRVKDAKWKRINRLQFKNHQKKLEKFEENRLDTIYE